MSDTPRARAERLAAEKWPIVDLGPEMDDTLAAMNKDRQHGYIEGYVAGHIDALREAAEAYPAMTRDMVSRGSVRAWLSARALVTAKGEQSG